MDRRAAVLRQALLAAAVVLRGHFGKVGYSLKGPANLLTKADIEAQRAVLSRIKKHFPEDDYLAEENARKITGARRLWVIDPLDGTTNYAHGFPVACTSVAVLERGVPAAGGIMDPFRDELFLAVKHKGAFLNGRRIRVSKTGKLAQALLITGFAYDRAKRPDFYCGFYKDFLKICHDIRRSGSAAIDLAWIACGRADGMWEFKLNPWDVAAGKLLIEEAGGAVTDFKGLKWGEISSYGKETLASNGLIHTEVLRIIKKRLQTKTRPPR